MASYSLALIFILGAFLASAAANDSRLCNKCCTRISTTCQSTFVDGQNEFDVVANDTVRPGSMQVFNAPCTGSSNGKYVGIITNAGGGDEFQTAKIEFPDGIVTFTGDASSATSATVVYAVTGGTGRYTGISGTATERNLGNLRYEVTISGEVSTNC